jgi:hypothetical protein
MFGFVFSSMLHRNLWDFWRIYGVGAGVAAQRKHG